MYTTDGVSCYITPLWKKENIRTNLCDQSGIPLKPKDLIPLRLDRWFWCSVLNFSRIESRFQLLPLFVSVVVLCEGMRGEAAASVRSCDSAGTVAGFPNLERKTRERRGGRNQVLSSERVQSAPPTKRFHSTGLHPPCPASPAVAFFITVK